MSFNFPPNGEEQQLNIIDTTNIDLSLYRLNKDGRYCNCPSKKGPHISEKNGHQFFTSQVVSMPITESVEQGKALPLPKFKHVYNPKNASSRKDLANYVKKQLSPDRTLKGYEKMLTANEGMLKYTSEKIFDYINI